MRARIAKYCLDHWDEVQAEAESKKLDARCLLVAKALEIDYESVTPRQRAEAKNILFAFAFGSPHGVKRKV